MVSDGLLIPDHPLIGSGSPAMRDGARAETTAGIVLLGLSIVAAVVVRLHPGPNALDRRGFTAIARSPDSTLLLRIADLSAPGVLVVGTILAAVVALRSDRWRAAACVAGPLLTAALVEYVFKPLVARRYLDVLSYPSGNVADLAAVATAWALAVPSWIRPVVAVVGAAAVGTMMVAVIGLRWHYPTDAFAGAVLGVAVVLLVDGSVHLLPLARRSPPTS